MNARVQAPELRGNMQLRPAPIQSDTYARPAAPPTDNRLGDLANALSSFSSSVGNFARTVKQTDEKSDAYKVQKFLAGKTQAQKVAAIRSGAIEGLDEEQMRSKAAQSIFGSEYGQHRTDQLKESLMTDFDWDTQDVDQFISKAMEEDLAKFGTDPNFGASYIRQVQNLRGWATDFKAKRGTEQTIEARHRAAFGFIDMHVDHGVKTGSDPDIVAKQLFDSYSVVGKDGTLGVDFDQLDQEVLNKARRIAGQNPEIALAILNHERKGRNGDVRSFGDNPDMRDQVLQITATANKAIHNRQVTQGIEQVYDNGLGLLKAGDAEDIQDYEYTTAEGRTVTLTKDQITKEVTKRYLSQSQQIARARREGGPDSEQLFEAPAEQVSRELNDFRQSGLKDPRFEEAVSGIASRATLDVLDDEEAKGELMGKLDAYRFLRAESTTALQEYTSKEDRQFGELFLTATEVLGHDPDTALGTALRAMNTPGAVTSKMGPQTLQTMQQKLDNFVEGSWFTGDNFFDISPANYAAVEQRVRQTTGLLIGLGMKPDKAVERAIETFQETTTVYRGSVLELQGMALPDDFHGTLDGILGDFAEKNPLTFERNDIDPDTVSIRPATNGRESGGRFVIVDEDGLPIRDDEGRSAFINVRDIRKASVEARQSELNEASRRAAEASSARQRKLSRGSGPDGSTVYFDKSGKEFVPEYSDGSNRPSWKPTGRRRKTVTPESKTGGNRTYGGGFFR